MIFFLVFLLLFLCHSWLSSFSNLSYFRCPLYALQITCLINGNYRFKYRCVKRALIGQVLVSAPPISNFEILAISLNLCLCVHARMRGVTQMPSFFEARCDLKDMNQIYGISTFTKKKYFRTSGIMDQEICETVVNCSIILTFENKNIKSNNQWDFCWQYFFYFL